MTRIQALFAAAAVAVGLGATLSVALQDEAANLSPPMSCAEYAQALEHYSDVSDWYTFFVATTGATPPEAYSSRPIGVCSGGECVISRADCPGAEVRYSYDLGPVVNSRRLIRVHAPRVVGGALKAWATDTSGVTWIGSFGQVMTTCQGLYTEAQCLTFAGSVHECWQQLDGTLCRYGYTSAGAACSPQTGAVPIPCVVYRGAGSETEDLGRVFADTDLE